MPLKASVYIGQAKDKRRPDVFPMSRGTELTIPHYIAHDIMQHIEGYL
jgi:hypothetical protein